MGFVFMATGFVGGGGPGWFVLGWFRVGLMGSVSLVAGVGFIITGFVGVLGGGFLGLGWLLSLGGWVVGWSWSGLGMGWGWLLGLVGLSLIKNGSIGLVVRSLSLVGLSLIGLVLVLVTVGGFSLGLVRGRYLQV